MPSPSTLQTLVVLQAYFQAALKTIDFSKRSHSFSDFMRQSGDNRSESWHKQFISRLTKALNSKKRLASLTAKIQRKQ